MLQNYKKILNRCSTVKDSNHNKSYNLKTKDGGNSSIVDHEQMIVSQYLISKRLTLRIRVTQYSVVQELNIVHVIPMKHSLQNV